MKSASVNSMVLLALIFLSGLTYCVPVTRRQASQNLAYSINSPTENATLVAGQDYAISWTPGKNIPLNASLVPEYSTSNQTAIFLQNDINGSTGTFVVYIPQQIENCTRWKVALSYEVENSVETSYSEVFYIANGRNSTCGPKPQPAPALKVSHDPMSGATGAASIDVLGDDGQPLKFDESSAPTFNMRLFNLEIVCGAVLVLFGLSL